jgi:Nickel insertion protein
MKLLHFHPSAGASGDMIMASLLDLGADLHAVRQAVESVGCCPEEERHHGPPGCCDLGQELPVFERCATRKALKNAVRVLTYPGGGGRAGAWRRNGAGPLHRGGALDRGKALYLGNGETVPGCKYRG